MKIVSVVTNNDIFVELQYNSIKKHFSDKDVEIIIFNDAKTWPDITNFNDTTIKKQITDMCNKLSIKCIDIPNSHHINQQYASIRHGDSVNFITQYMFSNPDKYLMLDCDMFFIHDFDISEFEPYDFCYVSQSRDFPKGPMYYPWPNFFYININTVSNKELINWHPAQGLDAGGKCALWLHKLDPNKIFKIQHLSSGRWNREQMPSHIDPNIYNFLDNDTRNKDGKYFAELYHEKILHYRASSNWMGDSFYNQNYLTELLRTTLTDKSPILDF